MLDLNNKKVLITGSSRGIGAEIARKMANLGAEVTLNYAHSQARAEKVQNEIETAGGTAHVIQADVSDFEQAAYLVKTAYKKIIKTLKTKINIGIKAFFFILSSPKIYILSSICNINQKIKFSCIKYKKPHPVIN